MTDKLDLDKIDPKNPKIEAVKGYDWFPALVIAWHHNGTATVLFETGELAHRDVNHLRVKPDE